MILLIRMKFTSKKEIYLDYASTTPIDKSILKKMYNYDRENFANASSIYTIGNKAKNTLEEKRRKLALTLQARKEEIYFVSGGTEANNIVIKGVVKKFIKQNKDTKPHIIVSSIEHASIIDAAKELEDDGVEVTYIKPKKNGVVRALDFIEAIKENTILLSLMYVNNEVGTIQPVSNLGKLLKEYRKKNSSSYPYLHTDACQAGNYLLVTVPKLKSDLITINASKVYGPKNIAALYIKNNVSIEPIIYGGGQEKGLRSGTENIALIVGLVESFAEAQLKHKVENERMLILQKYLSEEIKKRISGVIIWGDERDRISNNINIGINGISSEELVIRLSSKNIFVSSKSACSSVETDGSYVILELGGTEKQARETIRITMGRSTEKKDIDTFLFEFIEILKKYRKNDLHS